MTDALVHSMYFIGYGATLALAGVLIYVAMKVRLKNEGIPIGYGLLKLIFSASIIMWLGVGVSFALYPMPTSTIV